MVKSAPEELRAGGGGVDEEAAEGGHCQEVVDPGALRPQRPGRAVQEGRELHLKRDGLVGGAAEQFDQAAWWRGAGRKVGGWQRVREMGAEQEQEK